MKRGSSLVMRGVNRVDTLEAKEAPGEEGVSRHSGSRDSDAMVARRPKWVSLARRSLNWETSSWDAGGGGNAGLLALAKDLVVRGPRLAYRRFPIASWLYIRPVCGNRMASKGHTSSKWGRVETESCL